MGEDEDDFAEWPDELLLLGINMDEAEAGSTTSTTTTTTTTDDDTNETDDTDDEDEDAWPLEMLSMGPRCDQNDLEKRTRGSACMASCPTGGGTYNFHVGATAFAGAIADKRSEQAATPRTKDKDVHYRYTH